MFGTYSGSGLGFGLAFSLVDDFSLNARRIEREMAKLELASDAMAAAVERNMARVQAGVGMIIAAFIGLAFFAKAAKVDATFENYRISIETFIGDAERAREVMNNIKKDALEMPRMGFEEMMRANKMLITGGVDAEQSQRIIRNMSTMLVAVGRGSAELNRMGVNLQQLAAGTFNQRDVTQFSYAGLDLMKILRDYTGKTNEQIKEMGFSIDLIDKAFQKAAAPGTKYFEAVRKVMESTLGKMELMRENANLTWAAIGAAIRPATDNILDVIIEIQDRIQKFVANPFGAWVMRMSLNLTVMIGVLGVLLVLSKILEMATYRLAGAFTASTKATILKTIAERGNIAALKTMAAATVRATIAAIPMIATYAAIAAGLYLMHRAFESTNPAINALGFAIMFALGPLGIVVGAIMIGVKAVMAFNDVLEGSAGPQNGFLGWLQRLGGALRWVFTLLDSYNSEKKWFEVPENMINAMDSLGMGEFARSMATWIGRIFEFFGGMRDGLSSVAGEAKRILLSIVNAFMPATDQFKTWDELISRNTSNMDAWRSAGETAGKVLAAVLATVVIYLAATVAQSVLAAISFAAAGVAAWIAFSPVLTLMVLIMAAFVLLKDELNNWTPPDWFKYLPLIRPARSVNDMAKDYADRFPQTLSPRNLDAVANGPDFMNDKDPVALGKWVTSGKPWEASPQFEPGRILPTNAPGSYYPSTTADATGVNRSPMAPVTNTVKEKQVLERVTVPLVLDGKVIAEAVLDEIQFRESTEY